MAKKLRLTPEEKKMLETYCNQLPDVPLLDKDGEAVITFRPIIGSTVIDNYAELKTNWPGLEEESKIKPELYYRFPTVEYIDKKKRFSKALLKGNLSEEVNKHKAEHLIFINKLADNKEKAKLRAEEKAKLSPEQIEKHKQAESDAFYLQQRAAEKASLGHSRKRYHK